MRAEEGRSRIWPSLLLLLRKPDARIPEDFHGGAIFEAPNLDDARRAVEAVKTGCAQIFDRDLWSSLLGPRTNR